MWQENSCAFLQYNMLGNPLIILRQKTAKQRGFQWQFSLPLLKSKHKIIEQVDAAFSGPTYL
jgi:hypothetical protein